MADPPTRLNATLEGRYRIERRIGEGGMATVYLARDLKHGRNVALKVLKPELAAVVGAERFLAEIETTASLQHPHILPLFDSGEADGFLYYVMPHVEGESLRERLDRQKQLPVDEAVRIASDVASALAYAHSRGVIHRDVKPANILLQAGRPVVSDFGIALAVSAGGGARLTETGLSLGTPHYMSPEQATGDLPVGAPSDVYALGCVLFEMLLGEPPYSGGTAQAILGKIITGTPERVSERRRSVPANVDGAIRCALAKVPADRFASAEDFARALGDPSFRFGDLGGVGAASGPGGWRAAAIALGVVALASSLGLAWLAASDDPAPPSPVTRLTFNLPEGDLLSAGDRNSPGLALSPDGQHLVYIGRRDGVDRLYHRALASEQVAELQRTEGAMGPFFSPDGGWVGFFAGTELRKTTLTGGVPVLVTELEDEAHGGTWGPDDTIYFGLHESSIWRVPAEGGAPQPVTTLRADGDPPEVDHKMPQLLPEGRGVLFEVQAGLDESSYVAVHDPRTGDRKPLVTGANPWYVPTGHLLFTRGGSLWAVRFDLEELALAGEPISVVEDVSIDPNGGAAQLAVAPDGTLVFASGGPTAALTRLVRVDREGRATGLLPELASYGIPRVSPDGERLAVNVAGLIWVVDLGRLARTRLNAAETGILTPFTWTADSRSLTFSARSVASREIRTVAADGAGEPETVVASESAVFPGSWSPDGESLAYYVNDPETRRDIWVRSGDGSANPFVRTDFEDMSPTLSPGRSLMAYVSNLSGRFEVYVEPYPGPGGRVTVSTNGGVEPAWSPDGATLFYRNGPDVLAVDVATEPALRVGEPRLLFSDPTYVLQSDFSPVGTTAFYDVLPDGQGFVMIRADDELAPARIHVVRNWLGELEERVPR